MKRLRDAVLVSATIALLLYAAMTAAKNMAGALQTPGEASAAPAPRLPAVAGKQRHDDFPQLARRDD